MTVYGHFGPEVLNKVADPICHGLERPDLSILPEGQLLMIFCALLDSGINAFHLWETTMQGDILVPNFRKLMCK